MGLLENAVNLESNGPIFAPPPQLTLCCQQLS